MVAAYETFDRSRQAKSTPYTRKRINIISNVQYFVENYFPALMNAVNVYVECSW